MDKPDWSGRTVVCIASGPSLTYEDCSKVGESGLTAIVTNTSFRMCKWADALFAFDARWWKHYYSEVSEVFRGRLFSYGPDLGFPRLESLKRSTWFNNFGNSGACAIGLAIGCGADRIILLGYDCQVNGKTHWHGDHPPGFSNVASIKRWPAQFRTMADNAKREGVEIINVSRETSLTCFERREFGEIFEKDTFRQGVGGLGLPSVSSQASDRAG